MRNTFDALSTALQTFLQLFSFFLHCSNLFRTYSASSKVWSSAKKQKKYQALTLSSLLHFIRVCSSIFTFNKNSLLSTTTHWAEVTFVLRSLSLLGFAQQTSRCPDWAPPTVFTPRGRCRSRNARVGGGPCEAAALSEQLRAPALFGGSRIEMGPAQWKCQREPEISPRDWWAFCSSLLKRCLSHLEGAYRRELAKKIYLWSRRQRVSAFFSSARVWSGASAIVRAFWRSSIWGFSLDVRVYALQLDGATL